MPTPFDLGSDLVIPAFDTNGQTLSLVVDLHPAQLRMLNYVLRSDRHPFRDRDELIRSCIALGLHSILVSPPNAPDLAQAKMDIIEEERFQFQKDFLAIAVEKYLAAGDKPSAARLVALSFEEFSNIKNDYLRDLRLSTLTVPIELLRQHGIAFNAGKVVLPT